MVHLVCLFTKMHLLVLLQDHCLNLILCAFLPVLPDGYHLNLLNRVTKNCQILLKTMSQIFS